MSHTQADIKRMIAKEMEDLKEILDGYKLLPEYQDATDEVERLRKQLTLAEKKQIEVIVDYKEECKDEIEFKRGEMSYLQDMLDDMKNGLNVDDYNQELVDMFRKFHSIYTTSQNKRLHWVDEFGSFAIFKTLSSEGVPVAWYLYEIKEDFDEYEVKKDGDYIWRTEGGHLAHLKFFGNEIVPMSKTTFYFVLAILVIVEIVQGRYQKKIDSMDEAEEESEKVSISSRAHAKVDKNGNFLDKSIKFTGYDKIEKPKK
jgi:hypothetical protein